MGKPCIDIPRWVVMTLWTKLIMIVVYILMSSFNNYNFEICNFSTHCFPFLSIIIDFYMITVIHVASFKIT